MFNLTEEIMWKGEKAKLVECYIGKTGVYGIYVSTFSRHIWDDEFVFRAVAPALLKDVSVSIYHTQLCSSLLFLNCRKFAETGT